MVENTGVVTNVAPSQGGDDSALPAFLVRFALFLLILTGVFVALLGVEGAYRAGLFPIEEKATWTDRPTAYYQPRGATTLQDFRYGAVKDRNAFRISVVGDSFSFAPFMQFDDAFPKRLERILNFSRPSSYRAGVASSDGIGTNSLSGVAVERAEVLNLGVPGYSTSHEVQAMRRAVELKSNLVVLQVTLNDPQRKVYVPTGLTGQNQFGPYQPTGVLARLFGVWKSGLHLARWVHGLGTKERYRKYYFELFASESNWSLFKKSLLKIKRIARDSNVPVVVVLFPLFGVQIDESYPFLPLHKKISNLLDRRKIPVLDLTEIYSGIPVDRLQVVPGVDYHPNEIAHRMAAERIYDWLIERELIPQGLRLESIHPDRTGLYPK